MLVSVILALILRLFAQDLVLDLYVYQYAACPTETCAGNQGVYRISFVLFLFFFLMFLSTLSESTASFHHTMWPLKIILYICLLVFAFLLPNDFYSVYSYICRFFSAVFLILQMIALIDSFYVWNENWVAKNETKYYVGIVILSLLSIATAFTFLGLGYGWYASGDDCGLQKFFLSFAYILITAFTLIAISDISEHGALLPSALVAGYVAYLVLVGLNSDPSSCNTLYDPNDENIGVILVGILVSTISIIWSSWRVSTSKNLFRTQEDQPIDVEMVEKRIEDNEPVEDEEILESPEARRGNKVFHLVMALAAMYMAMLLTNWSAEVVDSDANLVNVGSENMWVNVVSSWVCCFLYLWTLVAPSILTGREF